MKRADLAGLPQAGAWRTAHFKAGWTAFVDARGRIRIGPAFLEHRRHLSPDDPRLLTIDEALSDHVLVLEAPWPDGGRTYEVQYLYAVAELRDIFALVDSFTDYIGAVRSTYREMMPDLEH